MLLHSIAVEGEGLGRSGFLFACYVLKYVGLSVSTDHTMSGNLGHSAGRFSGGVIPPADCVLPSWNYIKSLYEPGIAC